MVRESPMPFLVRLVVLMVLIGSSAFAQSLAPTGLERLSPPVRVPPPRLTPAQELCRDLEAYANEHREMTLVVQTRIYDHVFDPTDRLHLQALRHWTVQDLLNERASEGPQTVTAATQRMHQLTAVQMLERLRRRFHVGPQVTIRLRYTLQFSRMTWCSAVRANREPDPSRAVSRSFFGWFCAVASYVAGEPGNQCPLLRAPEEPPVVINADTADRVDIHPPVNPFGDIGTMGYRASAGMGWAGSGGASRPPRSF